MQVFSYNLRDKFGDGLDRLGVKGVRSLSQVPCFGEKLVLWHGPREDTKQRLRKDDGLHVLHIGSDPVQVDGPQEREYGLEYGFANRLEIKDEKRRWDSHPEGIREKLCRFIEDAKGGTVNPDTLKPPAVPEHVIACYLAVLAERSDLVRDAWRGAFEDEVAALGKDRANPLTWDSRTDAHALRTFLVRE